MPVSSDVMLRLSKIDMSGEALREVLAIIGELAAENEARLEKDRHRKSLLTPRWAELRNAVFKRDDFICAYCGEKFDRTDLHCDHVVPLAKGGESVMENLVASCGPCNISKGALDLEVWRARQ